MLRATDTFEVESKVMPISSFSLYLMAVEVLQRDVGVANLGIFGSLMGSGRVQL